MPTAAYPEQASARHAHSWAPLWLLILLFTGCAFSSQVQPAVPPPCLPGSPCLPAMSPWLPLSPRHVSLAAPVPPPCLPGSRWPELLPPAPAPSGPGLILQAEPQPRGFWEAVGGRGGAEQDNGALFLGGQSRWTPLASGRLLAESAVCLAGGGRGLIMRAPRFAGLWLHIRGCGTPVLLRKLGTCVMVNNAARCAALPQPCLYQLPPPPPQTKGRTWGPGATPHRTFPGPGHFLPSD